jgi:DNA-binding transcriptional LysR family regulator
LELVTTHTQARYVLPPAIVALRELYPDVSFHLSPEGEGDVLDRLARGEADFALISTTGPAPQAGLAVPLYRWRRVVLVPASHPLAQSDTALTLEALAAFPLLSYESSSRNDSSLRRAFAAAEVEPNFVLTAREADLIKTYVRAGLGVGLLAEMALSESEDDLRALPAPAEIPECTAWAVLPHERVLRDYALDLVVALAPQLDRRDLRRALEGNIEAEWPVPPAWGRRR